MIKYANRYVETVIHADELLNDVGRGLRFVSQKPYPGKPEANLAAGATVTLQITEDNSSPIVDEKTGRTKDNNVLETFDATIVGVAYPLDIQKGDIVELGDFIPEASYFIKFNLILRFRSIRKVVQQHTVQPTMNAVSKTLSGKANVQR